MGPIREWLVRLLHALIGPDARRRPRQASYALLLSSGGDLLAGVTLGSIQHTLEQLPGLLVLIPAAIGMRGNIFGALGSRLGTSIHTGTFTLSRRRSTVVGQNLLAAVDADVRRLAGAGGAGQVDRRSPSTCHVDLAARLRRHLDGRRHRLVGGGAGHHGRRGRRIGPLRLGHGQRRRPRHHRRRRHGDAAVAVPGHVLRGGPVPLRRCSAPSPPGWRPSPSSASSARACRC